MTPDREDEHRARAAKGLGGAEAVIELLTALDEVRAREARLAVFVARLRRMSFALTDDADKHAYPWPPTFVKQWQDRLLGIMHICRNDSGDLADPSATTWLAGRERAAWQAALRWMAAEARQHVRSPRLRDVLRSLADSGADAMADAIEAGKEPTP